MADEAKSKGRKQLEEEVMSAIAAFEQILEAMPDDRASLETLSHAYGQIGDHAKSYEYLLRLGRVLVAEGDQGAARDLLGRLRDQGGTDSAGMALIGEIEAMTSEEAAPSTLPPVAPVEAAQEAVSNAPVFSEELAFIWNLLQADEITQDEYASLVDDLTEMSGSDSAVTVSLLHALEARGYKGLDRVLTFASQDSGVPYISLDSIDIPEEAGSLLPLAFVVRRGALVFDFLGGQALAVVMNPYDAGLRKDVERLAQRPCNFFMSQASEFDRAVERITNIEVATVPGEA